jgi:Porin subfamily
MRGRSDFYRWKRAAITAATLAMICKPSASAHAVEYLKVCSAAGSGNFYIPGTDSCLNANLIADNQFSAAQGFSTAMMGIAMSSALVTPFLPDNARFAVSVHWAGFDSKNAIGIGGVMRIRGNLSLTGGVAFGNDSGSVDTTGTGTIRSWGGMEVLGKLGMNYAW